MKPARRPNVSGLALMALVGGAIVVAFSFAGCATAPSVCRAPEEAFPGYVANERKDPTATSAGPCETGQTEDTGDEFTICPIRTARHGVIHKRLMTRACWQ